MSEIVNTTNSSSGSITNGEQQVPLILVGKLQDPFAYLCGDVSDEVDDEAVSEGDNEEQQVCYDE